MLRRPRRLAPWLLLAALEPTPTLAKHSMGPYAITEIKGDMLIDGSPKRCMGPGQAAEWVLGFFDAENARDFTEFDLEHEKYMHLVVISRDLASFAHVHPELDRATGLFRLGVNQAHADPDNRDAEGAVARPGLYFLFGEFRPKGEILFRTRLEVRALGRAHPRPWTLDAASPAGEIRKHFSEDGSPAQGEGAYRLTLGPPLWAGMLHLPLHVEHRLPDGSYRGVQDLEDWLSMPGHAIMVSRRGRRAADKVFQHMHTMEEGPQGRGPRLTFMAHGQVPPPGVYRLWVQLKLSGRVLTFPFALRLPRLLP